MMLSKVDRHPDAHPACDAGFDHLDPGSQSRPMAVAMDEVLDLVPGERLPHGQAGPLVRKNILVFSGASRLTRFVHTTHVSMKGDPPR